jgi:hypothetical protein
VKRSDFEDSNGNDQIRIQWFRESSGGFRALSSSCGKQFSQQFGNDVNDRPGLKGNRSNRPFRAERRNEVTNGNSAGCLLEITIVTPRVPSILIQIFTISINLEFELVIRVI